MHDKGITTTKWLGNIINILDECGLSYVWNLRDSIDVDRLVLKVKQTLKDHFIQKWHRNMDNSGKAISYRIYLKLNSN